MNKKLILHIGMAKTGTSSLQSFLYINREVLKENGYYYPVINEEVEDECYDFSKNGYFFYDAKQKMAKDTKNWTQMWKIILNELKNNNVIVSSENISIRDTLNVIKESKKMYDDIKVVIYLRRQDRYIESLWNHIIKDNGVSVSFDEFVDGIINNKECNLDKNDLNYTDMGNLLYFSRLEEISQIIGQNNLIVRVYEKGQLKGKYNDIISDFLHTLNIDIDWSKCKMVDRVNERLDGSLLEIKRIFNASIRDIPDVSIKDAFRCESKKIFMEEQNKSKRINYEEGYFDSNSRVEFMKLFEEENRLVAKKYFDREDGILFYDNNYSLKKSNIELTENEEKIIKVFSKHLRLLDNKYNKMNKMLIDSIIASNIRDRKLAFFGAGNLCKQMIYQGKYVLDIIIDNDINKQGNRIKDIDIIFSGNIKNWNEYYIIISCKDYYEIEEQLKSNGLKKYIDYLCGDEILIDNN